MFSPSTQCGLGLIFSAIFLVIFWSVKFRDAGNNSDSPQVALQAHGESHNYSLVAIVLVVVVVVVAMFAK